MSQFLWMYLMKSRRTSGRSRPKPPWVKSPNSPETTSDLSMSPPSGRAAHWTCSGRAGPPGTPPAVKRGMRGNSKPAR